MASSGSSRLSCNALVAVLVFGITGCAAAASDEPIERSEFRLEVDVAAIRPESLRIVVTDREDTPMLDETVAATGPTVVIGLVLPVDHDYVANIRAIGTGARECARTVTFDVDGSLAARGLLCRLQCSP
jgi:hypothetical protein